MKAVKQQPQTDDREENKMNLFKKTALLPALLLSAAVSAPVYAGTGSVKITDFHPKKQMQPKRSEKPLNPGPRKLYSTIRVLNI